MNDLNKTVVVTAFGWSDLGLVRQNNEDSFLVADLTMGTMTPDSAALKHVVGEKGSLFLVADGMGGAEAGEIASQMAVELVAQQTFNELETSENVDHPTFVKILKQSIEDANLTILQESRRDNSRRGMGTTLTAAAVHDRLIFFAQLGDSRAYLIRNGSITQMTRDQSLVAQLIASGALRPEEAKAHPQRHVILQALGIQNQIDVAISFAPLKKGDRVLLCSDGLSGNIDAEEVRDYIDNCPEPQDACHKLVALARERGGEDNITVVVIRFDGDGLIEPGLDDVPAYKKFEFKVRKRRFFSWGRGREHS